MHFIVDIANEETKKSPEIFMAPTPKRDQIESYLRPVLEETSNY